MEKYIEDLVCRKPRCFDEDLEDNIWVQCDLCMRWRLIHKDTPMSNRWKCGDSGTSYTCEMGQVMFVYFIVICRKSMGDIA